MKTSHEPTAFSDQLISPLMPPAGHHQPPVSPQRGFLWALGGGVLSSLAVLAIYWPASGNGFIWDDLSYLGYSSAYRDPALWREALFHPPTGAAVFRPLALLSFALPLWAGFTDPAPHHIANLAIHALNVLLVTLLAWRMFGRNFGSVSGGAAGAALSGLVYGVHPALTEPVLWIACRFDLMMALFLFLAMLADRAWGDTGWQRVVGVSLLFLAALLCKETAVGFMLALPVLHLAIARMPRGPWQFGVMTKAWAPHIKVYIALAFACAIYLLLRAALLGPMMGLSQVMVRFGEIGAISQRVLVIAASYTEYIADVIWPFTAAAPNRVLQLPVTGGARVIPALVGVCGVAGLAAIAVRSTSTARVPGLLIFAFLGCLLPVANILPAPTYPGELQIAVRYITFPLAFVCLAAYAMAPALAAGLRNRQPLVRKLPWLMLGAWLAASIVAVHRTIPLWHDEGTFFRWAIARAAPSSRPYLYINLGSYYVNVQDLPQAREAFGHAVEAQPRTRALASLAWYNLGNVEDQLGNSEQAIRVLQGALVVDPGNLYARASLARLERLKGDAEIAAVVSEEGLRRLRGAGRTHPIEGMLHLQLGLAYRDLARFDEAAVHLTAARAGAPTAAARAEAGQALQTIRGDRH